jgi:predicted transglutaminase-like cysteine proteinase
MPSIREELQDLIIAIINLPRMEKIKMVNNFFNIKIEYSSDYFTYRVKDYWATLKETLENGRGDCDDYSLAKRAVLKIFGIESYVSIEQLEGVVHMVCIVEDNGIEYVLDNSNPFILPREIRNENIISIQLDSYGIKSKEVVGRWKLAWEDYNMREDGTFV